MEAFGEYRVGNNPQSGEHWIECRGEVIGQVRWPAGASNEWRYGRDNTLRIVSAIPGWTFDGTYRSVGHALLAAARSHRRFVEPNPVKRLWRGMALWPAWGKVAAVAVGFAAVSETMSYFAPDTGPRIVAWFGRLF